MDGEKEKPRERRDSTWRLRQLEADIERSTMPYKCAHCGASYGTPEDLAPHLERHREVHPPETTTSRGKVVELTKPCPKGCGRHFRDKGRGDNGITERKAHVELCDGQPPLPSKHDLYQERRGGQRKPPETKLDHVADPEPEHRPRKKVRRKARKRRRKRVAKAKPPVRKRPAGRLPVPKPPPSDPDTGVLLAPPPDVLPPPEDEEGVVEAEAEPEREAGQGADEEAEEDGVGGVDDLGMRTEDRKPAATGS